MNLQVIKFIGLCSLSLVYTSALSHAKERQATVCTGTPYPLGIGAVTCKTGNVYISNEGGNYTLQLDPGIFTRTLPHIMVRLKPQIAAIPNSNDANLENLAAIGEFLSDEKGLPHGQNIARLSSGVTKRYCLAGQRTGDTHSYFLLGGDMYTGPRIGTVSACIDSRRVEFAIGTGRSDDAPAGTYIYSESK